MLNATYVIFKHSGHCWFSVTVTVVQIHQKSLMKLKSSQTQTEARFARKAVKWDFLTDSNIVLCTLDKKIQVLNLNTLGKSVSRKHWSCNLR